MKKLFIFLAALVLAACSKSIQTPDAIRTAVVEYLNARQSTTGLDLSAMQLDVTALAFEKDQARATIRFTPKTGGGSGGMDITYQFERKGNKWAVKPKSAADAHGNMGSGGGMPDMPTGEMPAGHPTVPPPGATPQGELPQGHPSVTPKGSDSK